MMNSEAISSWLMHANWYFVIAWIALLAAAVAATLRESPAPRDERR